MRISDLMLTNNYTENINNVKSKINRLSEQISTGNKINRPSDSPTGISKLLELNKQFSQNNIYSESVSYGKDFMEETVGVLENINDEVTNVLSKLTEVNDPTKSTTLNAYANEIDSALNSILSLANTEYNGKYLFGGTDFSDKPFGYNAGNTGIIVKTSGTSGKQVINISYQHEEQINLPGSDVFGNVDPSIGNDVFNVLISIRNKLQSGNLPDQSDIDKLKNIQSNFLDQITKAGVIINNLDNTSEMLSNQNVKLQELISNVNDVDVAKAIMEMQNQDYVLQISYKMSAMILPKSLIDFL
ncbi:flagellar hook-associated protein FlgL [Melioribacteraceae bacterium 4301-Me]|uniref:flagellar hook-associated protein FlgL n=1 Tax=Pyranulibacter aquaticus TaxID=3163344 RepID=UPI00359565A9